MILSVASRSIEVSQPTATQVKVRLPFHLRLSNLHSATGPQPLSPMGITGRIAILANFELGTGTLTVHFASATVTIEDVAPADGQEGTNYTTNKTGASLFGIDLETLLKNEMRSRGQQVVAALGDKTFALPTVS